jgi:hypothetical protein
MVPASRTPAARAVLLVDDEGCIRASVSRVLQLQQVAPGLAGRILVASGDLSQPDTTVFLERTGAPALLKPYGTRDLLEALKRMCARPAGGSARAPTPHQDERRAVS